MRIPTPLPFLIPLLVLLAAAAPGAGLHAQERGPDRERLEQRVRARMGEVIRQRLGLDEAQGRRLGEIMESLHEERRQLRDADRTLRREVAAWSGGADPSPEEARAALDRMIELREAEARLFRVEQERLLEILTPQQVVTFHALRQRMGERLQELRGRGPRGGPPGAGGPPGPRRPGPHRR